MHERVKRVVSYCADNGVKALDSRDGKFRIYAGSKFLFEVEQNPENIENWLGSNCDIIDQLSDSVVTRDY
jgi:hypothetical protein